MKSNIILSSSDRDLFGVTISQETKTGFLSISDLQKAYEKARWQYGWTDHRIVDIMQTQDFKDRVFYLLENQGFINVGRTVFMEMVKREGISKVLKGLGVYKTTGARESKKVMANPYIWVLLAMELNPMIYAKVIIWLTDTLIFNRIDAGSEYMPMNSKIKEIVQNPNYPLYARLINTKVFGHHQVGIRNLANALELRKIADIEKQIITAIDMKWIKNEDDLVNFLNSK